MYFFLENFKDLKKSCNVLSPLSKLVLAIFLSQYTLSYTRIFKKKRFSCSSRHSFCAEKPNFEQTIDSLALKQHCQKLVGTTIFEPSISSISIDGAHIRWVQNVSLTSKISYKRKKLGCLWLTFCTIGATLQVYLTLITTLSTCTGDSAILKTLLCRELSSYYLLL